MKFLSGTYVLDTSVFAQWFRKEEWTEKALPFLEALRDGKIKIVLPEVCLSEFANTCLKRVRRGIASMEEVLQHIDSLIQLPIEWYPDRELLAVAVENGDYFGISAYDAFYVSLAEVYGAPLITADQALYKACRGSFDFIEYLGDLKEK